MHRVEGGEPKTFEEQQLTKTEFELADLRLRDAKGTSRRRLA